MKWLSWKNYENLEKQKGGIAGGIDMFIRFHDFFIKFHDVFMKFLIPFVFLRKQKLKNLEKLAKKNSGTWGGTDQFQKNFKILKLINFR